MLLRMIVYAVIFYVIWKVIQGFGARMQQPRKDDRRAQKSPKDFSNIQDAEFEDLTKKESGGPKKGE